MISYKHCYPFRLATTSFIYPADYITNVGKLGPYLDEVELLLFESQESSLPAKSDIKHLDSMARDMDLVYNIHLPIDLDLSARPGGHDARHAIDRLAVVFDRVRPLCATTHTLHLVCHEKTRNHSTIAGWQDHTMANLDTLLTVTAIDPRHISLETLDYPPQWFAPHINRFNLAVCVDIGHILRYGFNLKTILHDFHQHIRIVHLHGVINQADHQSVSALDPETKQIMLAYLENFYGTVSLEVFSLDLLEDSLASLAQILPPCKNLQLKNHGSL
jgi:hypothetical protein